MSFPRLFRRLFAGEGAGPLLRQDILPPVPAELLPNIPADLLPQIPAELLPDIPADLLPIIPAELLGNVPRASAATPTAAGTAGLLALAADSDRTSRDKAATPAGVAAQFALKGGGLSRTVITASGNWAPQKTGLHLIWVKGAGGGGSYDSVVYSPGGAGGCVLYLVDITSLSACPVVIGAPGTNGAASKVGTGGGFSSITIQGTVFAAGGGGGASCLWHAVGGGGGYTAEKGANGTATTGSYAVKTGGKGGGTGGGAGGESSATGGGAGLGATNYGSNIPMTSPLPEYGAGGFGSTLATAGAVLIVS